MIDEEVTTSRLADIGQNLEEIWKMLEDLFIHVKVIEDQQREVGASSTSSPFTSIPVRRRAGCQLSPDQEGDLSEEVRQRVAKCMRQPPFITETNMDDNFM